MGTNNRPSVESLKVQQVIRQNELQDSRIKEAVGRLNSCEQDVMHNYAIWDGLDCTINIPGHRKISNTVYTYSGKAYFTSWLVHKLFGSQRFSNLGEALLEAEFERRPRR